MEFLVALIISLIPAIICAAIMSNKGRSGVGGFFLGFFTGFIGILIAALWPAYEPARRVTYAQRSTVAASARPQSIRASCSHCGYKNDQAARFCQHCGTTLTSFALLEHETISSARLKQQEREDSAETSDAFSNY